MVDSKSALMHAAADEFARRGFDGARIREIVERAGVNERMIYHHFGSKAGLYQAVLDDQLECVRTAGEPMLARALQMPPYAGMRAALAGYFDLLLARPAIVGLLLHEGLGGRRTISSLRSAVSASALRELYTRGQAEGVFRTDCPFEVATLTVTGALLGVLGLGPRAFKRGGDDRSEDAARSVRDQILAQLLDGMSGPYAEKAGRFSKVHAADPSAG
jgi:AcrR family transcriptional regulator